MILECDFGNSSLKWRVLEGGVAGELGRCSYDDGFPFLDGLQGCVSRVRVVSVATDEALAAFKLRLQQLQMPELEKAVSSPLAAGVKNSYERPGKLGADRWLAVVSAYNKYRCALLVVDAGTALTLDVVAADGVHLGGYILPGRGLMLSSLFSGTSKIAESEHLAFSELTPVNTQQAVSGGVDLACLGAVVAQAERMQGLFGEHYAVVLTGGDAGRYLEPLKACLKCQFIAVESHLVLDGLGLVMP